MKPEYKYKNTFLISSSLFCSICLEIFHNPSYVECEHVFCEKCINSIPNLNKKQKTFNCPQCRKLLKKSEIYEEKLVKEIIDNLEIYCSNRHYGCSWEGLVCEYEFHNSSCLIKNLPRNLKTAIEKKYKLKDSERFYDDDKKNNLEIEEIDKENQGTHLLGWYCDGQINLEFLYDILGISNEKEVIKKPEIDNFYDSIVNTVLFNSNSNKNNIINKTNKTNHQNKK